MNSLLTIPVNGIASMYRMKVHFVEGIGNGGIGASVLL